MSLRHTFVVCAYKESIHLEECIKSLINQSERSDILVVTSTPNNFISSLVKKYNLKLLVSSKSSSLQNDFNFAYSSATTELVTICHQDDLYEISYCKEIIKEYNSSLNPIILFTNYNELRDNIIVRNNKLLFIKRFMMVPIALFSNSILARRIVLSFGNPICCPSVTFNKNMLPSNVFSEMKNNLDWECWERLSKLKGSFCYIKKPLMMHRIHNSSMTTTNISNGERMKEDLEMFKKFWPEYIARILCRLYSSSQKSNEI